MSMKPDIYAQAIKYGTDIFLDRVACAGMDPDKTYISQALGSGFYMGVNHTCIFKMEETKQGFGFKWCYKGGWNKGAVGWVDEDKLVDLGLSAEIIIRWAFHKEGLTNEKGPGITEPNERTRLPNPVPDQCLPERPAPVRR